MALTHSTVYVCPLCNQPCNFSNYAIVDSDDPEKVIGYLHDTCIEQVLLEDNKGRPIVQLSQENT